MKNEYNYLRDIFILCLLAMVFIQDYSVKQNYRFTTEMFDMLEARQTLNFNFNRESNIFQYKILNYLLTQEIERNIDEN